MAFIFDSEEEFDAEQAGGDDAMDQALAGLLDAGDLTADEAEWDPWAGRLHLTYRDRGWYEGCGASMSGPAEPAGFSGAWAEDAEDDVESDMTKISDAVEKLGYGIMFAHADVKKGIADAEAEVKSDPEMAVRKKQGRYGDWDYTADCHVEIPVKVVVGQGAAVDESRLTEKDLDDMMQEAVLGPVREADDNGEKLASTAESILGVILDMFGIEEDEGAEGAAEKIQSILDKAGLDGDDAKKAIAMAEKKAAEKADPGKVKKAVKEIKAELSDVSECGPDEKLPESVVGMALETLRRMY